MESSEGPNKPILDPPLPKKNTPGGGKWGERRSEGMAGTWNAEGDTMREKRMAGGCRAEKKKQKKRSQGAERGKSRRERSSSWRKMC